MTNATKEFQIDTRNALIECARWLSENAEQLAETFAGGCRDWSVEFSAGDQGLFPNIKVCVNKIDIRAIDAYNGVREDEVVG